MILVTGASGFIGRSLMTVLQNQDRPAKAYSGRINDPLGLRTELQDVETIIHLAGAEGRGRIRLLRHVDLEGTERLIEEGQRAQVKRLIYVSRLNADRASSYPLLRIKGETERLIAQSGLSFTIIRSANLFGRDDHFFNVISSLAAWTWPLVWLPGGGKVAMQPLWVEDLVRCLVSSLDQPELADNTIEIAGEERMRYVELVQLAMTISGLRRTHFGPAIKLVRPLSALLFGWWRRPPVTRFMMDRFTVPEVAPLDSVYQQFNFRPNRINQRISYLRRRGLRLRLFRLR